MDVQAISANDASQTAAPAGVAPVQPHEPANTQDPPQTSGERAGIAPAIGKLFAHDDAQKPAGLDVSYHVESHPYGVVTVFTDSATGREVAQFPADVMADLAHLFDHDRGATLDKDA